MSKARDEYYDGGYIEEADEYIKELEQEKAELIDISFAMRLFIITMGLNVPEEVTEILKKYEDEI